MASKKTSVPWDDLTVERKRETFRYPSLLIEEAHDCAYWLQGNVDQDVTLTSFVVIALREKIQRTARKYRLALAKEKVEPGKLFPRRKSKYLRRGGNRGFSPHLTGRQKDP